MQKELLQAGAVVIYSERRFRGPRECDCIRGVEGKSFYKKRTKIICEIRKDFYHKSRLESVLKQACFLCFRILF